MDPVYIDLADQIQRAASARGSARLLVAIAGPPGSGKTTIARHVVDILNRGVPESRSLAASQTNSTNPSENLAVIVSMDGFHYPRAYLDELPNRQEAYRRRGAPWTFDVQRALRLVHELNESATQPASRRPAIMAPSFDHALKDPVADGVRIPAEAGIVVLEGNYLLLDMDGWRDISAQVHLRVFVDVDAHSARKRVAQRHVQAGIERTLEAAAERFDANDALNGDLIRTHLTQYDIRIESIDE